MRSLSREARHERRVQVIRLRKAGNTYDKIAALTGLSRTGVFNICKRHEALGAKALHDAIGGRKLGENRLLDPAQEALVRKLIADKTPDQLKMPYALWTRAAVAQLIEQRFGLRLQVRTMGKYLARWGFTPQKPMKKAYEQSPAAVKKWLDEDYPAIAARAKAEGAEIHWGDESGLRSDDVRGRGFAPKGQTPVVRARPSGCQTGRSERGSWAAPLATMCGHTATHCGRFAMCAFSGPTPPPAGLTAAACARTRGGRFRAGRPAAAAWPRRRRAPRTARR